MDKNLYKPFIDGFILLICGLMWWIIIDTICKSTEFLNILVITLSTCSSFDIQYVTVVVTNIGNIFTLWRIINTSVISNILLRRRIHGILWRKVNSCLIFVNESVSKLYRVCFKTNFIAKGVFFSVSNISKLDLVLLTFSLEQFSHITSSLYVS